LTLQILLVPYIGVLVDPWEDMDRFQVYVAVEELQLWVVIKMVFLLLSTCARRRFNVLHILDQVRREMEEKEYIHSVRNQTKGYAWIRLRFD
jgi:hypothetical protein